MDDAGISIPMNTINRNPTRSFPVTDTAIRREIPVIDIAPYRVGTTEGKQQVAAAVGDACRSVGFLVVTGHGIDPGLVRRLREVTAQFFSLPDNEKLMVEMPPDRYRGYMAEAESLAASYGQESPPDLKESLTIGPVEVPREDPYYSRDRAGTFFADNLWPERPTNLREVWSEYYRAMSDLATDVMRIFALALGLDENEFDASVDRHITNMSAIHYPPLLTEPLPGQLRGGAHTDFGSITIVQRDAAPGGLQVLIEGDWVDAPYVDDSFVINLGDLMAEWTNDEWVSTIHRVALPPNLEDAMSDRLSFTFFHQPNYDAKIEVISTCTGPDRPAKYGTTTSGAHIFEKIAAMRSPTLAAEN
jgi:isopenicillin N synthase-like dioxygenase